jgi:hypothetical protein
VGFGFQSSAKFRRIIFSDMQKRCRMKEFIVAKHLFEILYNEATLMFIGYDWDALAAVILM